MVWVCGGVWIGGFGGRLFSGIVEKVSRGL